MSVLGYAPLLALVALIATAAAGFAAPGPRGPAPRMVPFVGGAMIAAALASAAALWVNGPQSLPLFGVEAALRLDLVSAALFGLICFIGAIVLRYSRQNLRGDQREGAFLAWMSVTLLAVAAFVLAGHLAVLVAAWVAISLCLHQLLLFNGDRPGARRAGLKKFVVSRLGDAALIAAAALLWSAYGVGDLAAISEMARAGFSAGEAASPAAIAAAACLAIAAILKSAQFPTHGWLTEVMEAPTPVSALLHAGVINAGGALLIRFADVMVAAPGVLAVLAMVGGFTALFGGFVMLTQPAVKTSLAWSTISQMGFMMLQCGLALFPLALLHIVAHSLYKAHAFLSSGAAVETVVSGRRPGPVATPSRGAVARAFVVSLAVYAIIGALVGFDTKSPQSIALGAILIFGVAYLLAQGFADEAPQALTQYTAAYSLAATIGYFALQRFADALLIGTLPATPAPGPLEWTVIAVAVASFGAIAVAQATFPLWGGHPAAASLRVHLSNGFYVNALADRWLDAWAVRRAR